MSESAQYDELRGALQRLGLEESDIDDIVHLVGERIEAQTRRNDPECVAQEATRQEQLTKLLKNEDDFVSNLNVVTKSYLFPIQSGVVKMKTSTMLAIFSNFEMLAGLHKDLLTQLREAVNNFPNVSIGTLFGEFVPSMQVYTQYVNKFSASLAALEAERAKSKAFAQFLLSCEESHPLPLEALLSLPLNRIPHYRGVLSQILASTPRNGPEYIKLANVTRELSELQDYLNDSKTQSDNMATVFKIESRIVGREYPLNDLHRTFIKEGDMQVLTEEERDKKQKDSHIFLFNDILVVTKKLSQNQFRYKSSHSLQYNALSVRHTDLTLHLTHPTSRETIALGVSNEAALNEWSSTLQRVLDAMQRTTVFQTTLEEIMSREPEGTLIPSVLAQLISTLERTALEVPGLFRISGSSRTINSVISQLDRGIRVDLDKLDSHVLSGTLKQWLRTLKEPLIPFAFFNQLMECKEADNPVEALRVLMTQLPTHNVFVLKRIIQMCLRVAEHSEVNKMTHTNLAIVIGPNLCREEISSPFGEISISSSVGPLVELMQRQFVDIFPRDPPHKFSKATPKSAVVVHTPQAAKSGMMGASRRAPRISAPAHSSPAPIASVPSEPAPAPTSVSASRLPEISTPPTSQALPSRPSPPRGRGGGTGRVKPPMRGPRPVPPKPLTRGAPRPPAVPRPTQPPPPAPRDRSPSQHPPARDSVAITEPVVPAGYERPTAPLPPLPPVTPAPAAPTVTATPTPTPPPSVEPPIPPTSPRMPPPTVEPSISPPSPTTSPTNSVPSSPARSDTPPAPEGETPSGICERCQQPVEHEFIELAQRVWHPECFLCTLCSSDLSSGYFRSEGKPICKSCRRNRRTMPPPANRIN